MQLQKLKKQEFLFEVGRGKFFFFCINECSGAEPPCGFQNRQKIIVIFSKEGQRAAFRLNQASSVHFYVKKHLCNHLKSQLRAPAGLPPPTTTPRFLNLNLNQLLAGDLQKWLN